MFFENITAKWTFNVQQLFFGQKLSKVANIKTKSAAIAFFLYSSFPSPCSFFFSFAFSSVTVIL